MNPNAKFDVFSAEPRFYFGGIREADDVVALFHKILRFHPLSGVEEFSELLNAMVKIKCYSIALLLFDEMLQRKVSVNEYTLSTTVHCYCMLKQVGFAFAIFGNFFKRGNKPIVVTFTILLKGYFLVEQVREVEILFKKLLREKVCELNEVTYVIVIDGFCAKLVIPLLLISC